MPPTPALARPLVNLRYPSETLWRLLEGWSEYEATHRRVRRTWEEDSAISHHVTQTEGSFCAGAEDYADLDNHLAALAVNDKRAVELYWKEGLRSVKRVGKAMERDENLARDWIWSGTERLIVMLCGLTARDARAEARLYRERSHMRRV